MTLQELDELLLDTQKLARTQDKVAQNMAIAVLEIARQLVMLNQKLDRMAGGNSAGGRKKK